MAGHLQSVSSLVGQKSVSQSVIHPTDHSLPARQAQKGPAGYKHLQSAVSDKFSLSLIGTMIEAGWGGQINATNTIENDDDAIVNDDKTS